MARRLQQAAGGVSSAVLASARRREQTIELDSVQAELCSRVRHIPSGCACARPRRVPPGARIPRPGHRRARGGQVGHLLASERHQGARRGAAGSARSCQARSLCGEDEEGGGAARRRRSCTHVSDALACSLATPQVWAGSGAPTGFELGSDRLGGSGSSRPQKHGRRVQPCLCPSGSAGLAGCAVTLPGLPAGTPARRAGRPAQPEVCADVRVGDPAVSADRAVVRAHVGAPVPHQRLQRL